MAFIDDAFTDGEYGGTSDYVFTAASQADCMNYVYRVYGESKHVIGTVHSHGVHDSFFSAVDHTMMTSRCSEEVHLVLSPSHKTYVITFKDMDNCFHEIDLDTTAIGNGFEFERNTNGH